MSTIKDFSNWTKITKGYYRYVIAANVCYEIITTYKDDETQLVNLYIAGDWHNASSNITFFEREQLGKTSITIEEALQLAEEDYTTNME